MLVLLLAAMPAAAQEPSRESLIAAWEAGMGEAPGTTAFEARGDGVYFLEDESLPYEGELRLIGSLVRPMEGAIGPFSHMGFVEFELSGLPPERRASQSYYFWLEDRQNFYYSQPEQDWFDQQGYVASFQAQAAPQSFRTLSFMLNYGVWILLIAVLLGGGVLIGRQSRKARALMDDAASINQKARENLDRTEAVQKEMVEIARRSVELQAANNELLGRILDALRSR